MNRRQRQAQETREDILGAARQLFVERGYASTSLADVAARAGVAVQTIYDSVGMKRALAMALVDMVDEEADVSELAGQIAKESRPEGLIALQVQLTRQVQERCGDIAAALESAAVVEPEVRAVWAEATRRHRFGVETVVGRIATTGALHPELTSLEAARLFEVLTSAGAWSAWLQAGQSLDDCEALLNRTLRRLLLRSG